MAAETTHANAPSDAFRTVPEPVAVAPHRVVLPASEPARSSNLAGWAMGTAIVALVLAAASPVWVPLLRSEPAATASAPVEVAPVVGEQMAPLANRVEALEATVQRLAAANAAAPAARSAEVRTLALAGAVAQLRLATVRSTPFAVELAVAAGLADGREEFVPAIRILARHAPGGIATTRQLRARFADRAAAALMAEAGTDDVPLAAQMVTWFASTLPFGMGDLVHDLTMPATAAALKEAERRLAADDMPGAVAVLATLSDAAAAAMQPWIATARARSEADGAINLLVRTALAELPAVAR